ncbi:MAG: hypothetical protein JO159_04585 [Acidobacteria bacterium]|nr:hypothetical protein [Acidobacteriota bacterium]MBV9625559.1 hypothetical protein [Acidobacteriota bacterium]
MQKISKGFAPVAIFLGVLPAATVVVAASQVRYLHVSVSNPTTHELVRVNVPLMMAEKIIPAINQGELREGKVRVSASVKDLNVRAILDAVKSAPEGEFVTVENTSDHVRVAKEHGQMVVHVLDKGGKENVDVTIPWNVVEALISDTSDNQLNVEAGIKALESIGDTTLVRVSGDENVRIWVDSQNGGQ